MAWPWHFPPGQLAASACFFLLGVALVSVGAQMSYANIARQQACVAARREFVKDYFRKKFDRP